MLFSLLIVSLLASTDWCLNTDGVSQFVVCLTRRGVRYENDLVAVALDVRGPFTPVPSWIGVDEGYAGSRRSEEAVTHCTFEHSDFCTWQLTFSSRYRPIVQSLFLFQVVSRTISLCFFIFLDRPASKKARFLNVISV